MGHPEELLACGDSGLGLPSELLVYGLFIRLLGLVYCISFSSLFVQILSIAGSEGLTPARQVSAQLSVDFPSALHRLWYFPSVFQLLPPTDGALRGVCAAGIASGLAMVYGGAFGAAGSLLAWVAMLSLADAADLNYPWDCLLLEAGFLALLLPSGGVLPDLGAATAPSPAVSWALRWLLFRVLFGFGKLKFFGTSAKDSCYIKSFLIGMPIPTRSAWCVIVNSLQRWAPPVCSLPRSRDSAVADECRACWVPAQVCSLGSALDSPACSGWNVSHRDSTSFRYILERPATFSRCARHRSFAARHRPHWQLRSL